jgi:CheY-like chemotaxis protein
MTPPRAVLLVDADRTFARALAVLLRREGNSVAVASTRRQALQAARRRPYDLAIVDVLIEGGGPDLARSLAPRVGRLVLVVGARLGPDEVLEAALGFPVRRKSDVVALLRGPGASSNGRGSGAKRPAARPPCRAATAPAPGRPAPGPARGPRRPPG